MPLVVEAFKGVDKEIQNVMDRLREAQALGEKFLRTLRKYQLTLAPPATKDEGSGTREKYPPEELDFSDLLDKIPAALNAMIEATNLPKRLENIARLTARSFKLMIAQGYSFYEALTALKEPIGMLRDKFNELGMRAPPALRPILAMFEKMDKRPKLFEAMSGLLDILKAFTETGFMTQGLLKDLTLSAQSFVRSILGVSGNLKKALQDMGSLTKEQILMLAPLITPFLEAAQKFGLKLPDWVKDLAGKMGLKVEDAAIDQVPPLLDRIRQRMGKETTRIVKAIHDLEKTLRGIFDNMPGFQHGGIAVQPQLAKVAESGPEAIIPLDKLRGGMGMDSGQPIVIENKLYLDGRETAMVLSRYVPELTKKQIWRINNRSLTDV
jgi:hypothetical protein